MPKVMAGKNLINDLVRRRLRKLRQEKGLAVSQAARRAGIPLSSYSEMERGIYRIHLDHLFRILGALGAEIQEVWPIETAARSIDEGALYMNRINAFRLNEVVEWCDAEGGALFSVSDSRCRVLLAQDLSDFLLDRLIVYLQERLEYRHGLWFQRRYRNESLHLFLKAENCPHYVARMIDHYLIRWCLYFSKKRTFDQATSAFRKRAIESPERNRRSFRPQKSLALSRSR